MRPARLAADSETAPMTAPPWVTGTEQPEWKPVASTTLSSGRRKAREWSKSRSWNARPAAAAAKYEQVLTGSDVPGASSCAPASAAISNRSPRPGASRAIETRSTPKISRSAAAASAAAPPRRPPCASGAEVGGATCPTPPSPYLSDAQGSSSKTSITA